MAWGVVLMLWARIASAVLFSRLCKLPIQILSDSSRALFPSNYPPICTFENDVN
jgi:hypothetical protein